MNGVLQSAETIPFVMGFACGFMLTGFVALTVIFGLERLIYRELFHLNANIYKRLLVNNGSLPLDKI